MTPTAATHTVRLECACRHCAAFAARRGLPLPLAALVTPAGAAGLRGAPAHGVVKMAHALGYGAAQRLAVPVAG